MAENDKNNGAQGAGNGGNGNGNNGAASGANTPSLSKLFNFRPKEYCASSHGVRSRKMIKRWASELKRQRPAAQPKAAPKAEKKP